jgi:hypothetical protein
LLCDTEFITGLPQRVKHMPAGKGWDDTGRETGCFKGLWG